MALPEVVDIEYLKTLDRLEQQIAVLMSEKAQLRKAVKDLLMHSGIHDADISEKDYVDLEAERFAREIVRITAS